MEPCPFARPKDYGAHSLAFVIPPDTDHPLLVVCERCGEHIRVSLDVVPPLDDLPADLISALATRGSTR